MEMKDIEELNPAAEHESLNNDNRQTKVAATDSEEQQNSGSLARTKNSDFEKPVDLFFKNLKLYFCDFCNNTSIHGWKFLGEQRRYIIEKIWWFLVICTATYGFTELIIQSYRKWDSSPVIVTFATTETPIWNIPFPAVTICPEIKNNVDAFNLTSTFLNDNRNEDNQTVLDLFSTVCPGMLLTPSLYAAKSITLRNFLDFLNYFYYTEFDGCYWMGKRINCSEVFQITLTTEGLCYTFNMLNTEDLYKNTDFIESEKWNSTGVANWNLEDGYQEGVGLETFPRRTFLSSIKGGLQIENCVEDFKFDYSCSEVQGYKVGLHHPTEEPNMDNYFWLPFNQVVMAGVKPKMITTSSEVQSYAPEKRGCVFPNEKSLKLYEHYSQKNCLAECLVNYTASVCDCIPFYNLLAYGNVTEGTTKQSEDLPAYICAGGSRECVENAKVTFLSEEVSTWINHTQSQTHKCGCYPSCTSLQFDVETSQADYHLHNLSLEFGTKNSWTKKHCSRLYVYYKEMQFMTSERHELYGLVEFLANCGGLLGLMCGFSFTSAIEILYYLTLRLISNVKKFGNNWSDERN